MNDSDPLSLVLRFKTERPILYAKAYSYTEKVGTLSKIYQNLLIFNVYSNPDRHFKRYSEMSDALYELEENSILIHFTDISLYGVFTQAEYANLLKDLQDQTNIIGAVHINQISACIYIVTISELTNLLVLNFLKNPSIDKSVSMRPYQDYSDQNTIKLFVSLIHYLGNFNTFTQKINSMSDKIDKLNQLLAVSKVPSVYFIAENPFSRRVKIGKSIDCNQRLKELQTGSPSKLQIMAVIKTPNHSELESILHQKYKDRRIHGEWFEMKMSDIDDCLNKYSFI